MSSQQELMNKLAKVLEVDPRRIQAHTTSRDLEAWDSLGTMNVLYWVNSEFGIELGPKRDEPAAVGAKHPRSRPYRRQALP